MSADTAKLLAAHATGDGTIEVEFRGEIVEITPDEARELQRELTHSIAIALHGAPRLDLIARDELTYESETARLDGFYDYKTGRRLTDGALALHSEDYRRGYEDGQREAEADDRALMARNVQ